MKTCRRCKSVKPDEAFGRDKRYRDGLSSWCRECFRENNSRWAKENRKRLTAKAVVWRKENPEAWRKTYREYHIRNKERRAAQHAEWAKANSDKRRATTARRRAAKLQATPPFADKDRISQIYAEAARIESETGERMHVDHIVPLQHNLVCGLHCEANLQIIPGAINEAKHNKWPSSNAQRQGDFFVQGSSA